MKPILKLMLFTAIAGVHWSLHAAEPPRQHIAEIGDLPLVSGATLYDTRIGYLLAGTLDDDRSNVLVFPSWFTGTAAHLFQFGLIGSGALADTDRYYVIVVDALGDGVSTSPSNSARQGGADFPAIAIDDMVRAAHTVVTEHLGFEKVHAVMGVSMGGMQTFQWIAEHPDFMDKAVAIDGSPRMTSWDIAQWQAHEHAIETLQAAGLSDEKVMEFLPSISLLTLWTPEYYVENIPPDAWPKMLADSRQSSANMNPYDYLAQLRAMIGHDVYADFADTQESFPERVSAELLVIGNTQDLLVNAVPGKEFAEAIGARHVGIDSNCGHVWMGCETARAVAIVHEFLE